MIVFYSAGAQTLKSLNRVPMPKGLQRTLMSRYSRSAVNFTVFKDDGKENGNYCNGVI